MLLSIAARTTVPYDKITTIVLFMIRSFCRQLKAGAPASEIWPQWEIDNIERSQLFSAVMSEEYW